MMTTYRGYMIAVGTKEKSGGLWSAETRIWPVIGSSGNLFDNWKTDGCVSEREAEEAGRQWAYIRIDKWVASQAGDK